MSDILERMQDDVVEVLRNVPSLSGAHIIVDDEKDLEGRVRQKIQTANNKNGKAGLVVLVLFPSVASTEKNLPGPPVNVSLEIQTIESVTLNRSVRGTRIRSSEAALEVLRALHKLNAGSYLIHSDKNPVAPIPVVEGFMSHSVKLSSYFDLPVAPKARAVQAELNISGELILTSATEGAQIRYTLDDTYPSPTNPNSYLYTVPIANIGDGITVKAAAYKTDLNPSDVERIVYNS